MQNPDPDEHEDAFDEVDRRSSALVKTDVWDSLRDVKLKSRHLTRSRMISATRSDPAHASFDMLRTRVLQEMSDRHWSRLAVTSPTKGCGTTFVAANLAISMSRRESGRTILMDMDLRNPGLVNALGLSNAETMQDYLEGHVPPEEFLLRVGPNLAIGPNSASVENAAELLQETMTADVLEELQDIFCPDVILYDLPPVLASDEFIAFLPNLDAILLVLGGGVSMAKEVRRVEKLIGGAVPILGVILNRAEDA